MKLKIVMRNLYFSQAIILAFLVYAYFIWFPHSFTKLGGFYKTAWMLIFVDLVLGPLLVFFIYKENKKYLKFDMNVLLTIQLLAFLFGAHSLYLKHPAYAVFTIDRFSLININDIYPQQPWSELIKKHFFSPPHFVMAHLPKDSKERNDLMFKVILNRQPDIDSRPKYFTPLNQDISSIMNRSIRVEHLALDSRAKEILESFTARHKGNNNNDYAFFPLRGNNKKDMIWVFNKKTAKPIDILDIDPWNFKIVSNQNKNIGSN